MPGRRGAEATPSFGRLCMTNNNIAGNQMLGHNRKMTGAECLADMLKGYGVSHVFMVPAVLRRTFAEMERRTGIKRIHCHGEKAAAYMAGGYARASGRPGGCMGEGVGAAKPPAGVGGAGVPASPPGPVSRGGGPPPGE